MDAFYDYDAALAGVMVGLLIVYFLALGAGIASYVLQALGLYTLADRRRLPNPWMAWIPYANYWLIGGIVDDYEATRGIKRKWRVVLLVLTLIVFASVILMYVFMFVFLFGTVMTVTSGAPYMDDEAVVASVLSTVLPMYLFMIPMALAATALQFCYMICIYKIYESTVPEKAVKYLLLSLLVPMAQSICLFKCRKKGYERPKFWYMPMPVPQAEPTPVPAEPVMQPMEEMPPVAVPAEPIVPAEEPAAEAESVPMTIPELSKADPIPDVPGEPETHE
ncbi:MAG: hypothetical protein IJF56_02845 [Clostridia bacterium]|nr:hypothetical protein [Clostridia bacterium]